jgi:hypothetical protein
MHNVYYRLKYSDFFRACGIYRYIKLCCYQLMHCKMIYKYDFNAKAIPLQAWTGP